MAVNNLCEILMHNVSDENNHHNVSDKNNHHNVSDEDNHHNVSDEINHSDDSFTTEMYIHGGSEFL